MGAFMVYVPIPSMICAVLFRRGLLMFIFGISLVTKDGSRVSRLRALWRNLIVWSPCVPLPILIVLLAVVGPGHKWLVCLLLAALIALVASSLNMPKRGIPDRLSGTFPVLR
jgi:hypothetical protein